MQTTNYVMSDEMALGFFDADGAIILSAEKQKRSSGKNSVSFKVVYFLGQSLSKTDAAKKFADKFGGKVLIDKSAAEFRYNQSSEVGQKVRQFLIQNEPKNPYRLRDFYISEQIIVLLNKTTPKSRVDLVTLVRLVSNKSYLLAQNKSDSYSKGMLAYINATDAEIDQGFKTADQMLAQIEVKLLDKKQLLSKTKLSNDYVLGAHFGDGSLYISLSWKPPESESESESESNNRLRCEPEWSISGDNEPYCQAFANTFNGTVKSVDKAGQRKFALSGIKKCLSVLPLFENAPWMPSYKQEQFSRWRDSLCLLEAQEHFTEEGIRKLLDLTYDLAEKGSRKYTKEQYLEWGLAWLKSPNRQKREP